MAILLTPASPVAVRTPKAYRGVVAPPFVRETNCRRPHSARLCGAIAFSIAVPLVTVVLFATFAADIPRFPEAALATALYLPLYGITCATCCRGASAPPPPDAGAMAPSSFRCHTLLGAEWFYTYSAHPSPQS